MTKEEFQQRLQEQKTIQKPATVSLPSTSQMALNLTQSIGRNIKSIASGNGLRLTTEEANNRMNICNSCPFYISEQQRCGKCGCYMAIKTYLKAERCPIGKW
jgi:hypothetical protein